MALTTLLQYKTAVTSAGFDSVSDSTALLDAINEARQSIADERRWPWLEATGNTTLVLAYDTPSEALNGITDLLYVDAVRLELNGTYLEISYLTPQDLRDKEHIDRSPSIPLFWTQSAGQLRVYPSPDQAYVVSVDYIKTITPLAADADPDDFVPPDFKALVKWKAVEALAPRVRQFQLAQHATMMYDRELRRKEGRDAVKQRQTSQQVLRNRTRYSR